MSNNNKMIDGIIDYISGNNVCYQCINEIRNRNGFESDSKCSAIEIPSISYFLLPLENKEDAYVMVSKKMLKDTIGQPFDLPFIFYRIQGARNRGCYKWLAFFCEELSVIPEYDLEDNLVNIGIPKSFSIRNILSIDFLEDDFESIGRAYIVGQGCFTSISFPNEKVPWNRLNENLCKKEQPSIPISLWIKKVYNRSSSWD